MSEPMTNVECGMTNGGATQFTRRASRLIDELQAEGFSPGDVIAVAMLVQGLMLTLHKRPEVTLQDVEQKAVQRLRDLLRVLHVAREASLPGR